MNIKARLLYILIILFINGYSNSIGSTVIPTIASLLFFVILIPPLSKITKVDLLHEKFIELAFKKSKNNKASKEKPVKNSKEQNKEEAKQNSNNNKVNNASEGDGLFYDTEAPEELDYDKYVDGINDPSISTSIQRRPAKIFHRGYQLRVDKGTWYELYVKNRDDGPMSYEQLDDKELKMKEALEEVYLGSFLSELKDYGQCSFYVSDKQELLTLDKFLHCMESVYVNPNDGSDFNETTFNVNLKFLKVAKEIAEKKMRTETNSDHIEPVSSSDNDSDETVEKIIQDLKLDIGVIFYENRDSFQNLDGHSFKVRPGYGPDKFYLDWTDYQGTYEYTIQNLIHHMLWEDGHYHKILSTDECAAVKELIDQDPDNIYESNDKQIQTKLNKIYKSLVCYTGDGLHQQYEESFSKDDLNNYLRTAGY